MGRPARTCQIEIWNVTCANTPRHHQAYSHHTGAGEQPDTFVIYHSADGAGVSIGSDQVGRGRKRTFTPEQEAQIYQWAEEMGQYPPGIGQKTMLDAVLRQIQENWGVQISKRTLQRILKRAASRWPYFRQVTAN